MKVGIVTGTRADYGLLYPVMKRVASDNELELDLFVTGSHLSEYHGKTVDAIKADGFAIAAEIPLPLEDDSPLGISQAFAEGVKGCAHALASLQPDLLVLLGDRYECLACAIAASLHQIPIAHIHGGEKTEGAVDEFYRHAITKMAQLHFTSCDEYTKRVIQLGEHPDTVFTVGALGVENIRNMELLPKKKLEQQLSFKLGSQLLLTTFHPMTLDKHGDKQAEEVFAGFDSALEQMPDITMIITGANADVGGKTIDALSATLRNKWNGRVLVSSSLGQVCYLSAMKYCAAVVGNSSSGIIEAPSFKIPTVNIGDRQKGRFRATSIIDVQSIATDVYKGIELALNEYSFIAMTTVNPYEKEKTSQTIVERIKKFEGGVTKPFYDLPLK